MLRQQCSAFAAVVRLIVFPISIARFPAAAVARPAPTATAITGLIAFGAADHVAGRADGRRKAAQRLRGRVR
jgi:hypothetical protein